MSGIVGVILTVSFGVRTSVSFKREHRYHLADIIKYPPIDYVIKLFQAELMLHVLVSLNIHHLRVRNFSITLLLQAGSEGVLS